MNAAGETALSLQAGESDGDELTWQTSSVKEVSMLRTCRASGSSVCAEMRGSEVACDASGRSKSVAARRSNRRRPSGKAAAMNAGPRLQSSDSSRSCRPNKG